MTPSSGIKVVQNNGPVAGQKVPQLHFHVIPCYSKATSPSASTSTLAVTGFATAAAGVDVGCHPSESARGGGTADQGETAQQSVAGTASPFPPGPGSRSQLYEAEAGPLIVRLRNLLMEIPGGYSFAPPGSFVAWAGDAEAMERLGASMQVDDGWMSCHYPHFILG